MNKIRATIAAATVVVVVVIAFLDAGLLDLLAHCILTTSPGEFGRTLDLD